MEIQLDRNRRPIQVRVPGLHQNLGLGDAVAKVTQAVGIKPCSPCEERRRKLNEAVQFKSWQA